MSGVDRKEGSKKATRHAMAVIADGVASVLPEAIAAEVPFVKAGVAIFSAVKRTRVERFFRTLHRINADDPEALARLQAELDSKAGQEVVESYIDAVLATNSRVVSAAFALLYADLEDTTYSVAFKRYAITALRALADEMVGVYIELLQREPRQRGDRPTFNAWEGNMVGWPISARLFPSLALRAAAINNLTQRGLLLPIEWTGMVYPKGVLAFSYPEHTEIMLALLAKATALGATIE